MSLEIDAQRLAALERQCRNSLLTELSSLLTEQRIPEAGTLSSYLELRNELRLRLLDTPVVKIADADAVRVLRRVFGAENGSLDAFLRHIGAIHGHGLDEFELETTGGDLFYEWFSHLEYGEPLAQLRPIILNVDISSAIYELVQEAKHCFVFQQYNAVYALCRMAIEAGARDICNRNDSSLGENLKTLHNWRILKDKVAVGHTNTILKALYDELCSVVHARRSVTKDEARTMFHRTMDMIERLYQENSFTHTNNIDC